MLLFVGDLHLTDKSRDQYRFKIFDWIRRQQDKHSVAATFLAGDLTDGKDRHSATLVNRIVDGLSKLRSPVYISRGNHDYRDPNNPFFKFLNHIDGIHFCCEPTIKLEKGMPSIGIIPHYRTQEEFDYAVDEIGPVGAYLVHQTFDGAIAESGVLLSGLRPSLIESMKPPLGVLAGDVHKPQRQGIVTYIGCPYHVRFGDGFNPRVMLIDKNGKHQNLYFDAPFKFSLTVRDADDIFNNSDLAENDQVKLTIELAREEAVEWKRIKSEVIAACKEMGVEVHGCKLDIKTSKLKNRKLFKGGALTATFDQFCSTENISSQNKKAGLKLMED